MADTPPVSTPMIKSIASISNLAVFKNFTWDSTVRDANNRPVYFKPLNIIYGRNYSGKTTLSRILRSLETGAISDKYASPAFTIQFTDGTIVDQTSPKSHPFTVRVFNEDFVRSHLAVFFDDAHGIAPFAVLGDENAELAKQLDAKDKALGPEDTPGTLLAKQATQTAAWTKANREHTNAAEALEAQLRDKANAAKIGIKHNKLYGDANYDIRKIKADIGTVTKPSYVPLTGTQPDDLKASLKESPKESIPESEQLSLGYRTLLDEARSLVARRISVAEPIRDLLADAALQEWVRAGRGHHENKRTTCGFCGGTLPSDLWQKLDNHFNKESETLRQEIAALIARIDAETTRAPSLLPVDVDAFYVAYAQDAKTLASRVAGSVKAYVATLASIKEALNKRNRDIFNVVSFSDPTDASADLEAIRTEYETLRDKSNDYAASLNTKQAAARIALRLHEVATFIATIRYDDQLIKIAALKKAADDEKKALDTMAGTVAAARSEIAALKAEMTDERRGAEKVNHYLSHFFGHPFLSLQALPNEAPEGPQYRFEIHRDSMRAYHLSEGERSLIAFCYFVARLADVETGGTKPIIWIDDPVSSLDDNHIFFVHSLLNSGVAKQGTFGQLFISTHSLGFLKYLKRLHEAGRTERAYFIVDREGDSSTIKLMPKHLKEYATEFHYLFHQIHRCAQAGTTTTADVGVWYNFGNNIRKFLEMYLYFKYPDAHDDPSAALSSKLRRFCGDDRLAASLAERVENEYSHLHGLFERGAVPIDVPAMKQIAVFVLGKMQAGDPDQYESLLASIGASKENT